MKKYFFIISFISLLVAFMTGQATALPFEYSITGTASYWTSVNNPVFLNQSITGSFVLSDPVQTCPTCDSGHYNFSLSDMYIAGEGFELSGSGNIHLLYPGTPFPTESSWGEPDMDLDLGGYIAWESAGGFLGWDYQSFFYNEDGSIDLSFSDDPYRIVFWGSIYSGLPLNGDRYYLSLSATRGAAVPEPSTMLLLGTGLIGLAGWGRKKFKKKLTNS